MNLTSFDWLIVFSYLFISLGVGIWASTKAGKDTKSFFLAGRNMPWWLLGVSMVATTFSTDTPNLVTDLVRQNGVSGNWTWWAFLLSGMLTGFVYAKLWHRSGVNVASGPYSAGFEIERAYASATEGIAQARSYIDALEGELKLILKADDIEED